MESKTLEALMAEAQEKYKKLCASLKYLTEQRPSEPFGRMSQTMEANPGSDPELPNALTPGQLRHMDQMKMSPPESVGEAANLMTPQWALHPKWRRKK